MKQYWADASTKNCVWLFQTKQKICSNAEELDCMNRDDVIRELLKHTKSIREIIESVRAMEDDGEYPECLVKYRKDTWHTEGVFLLREEARTHGKSREYDWGEENVGWRIYGVPLYGRALELLASCGIDQEFIDSYNVLTQK